MSVKRAQMLMKRTIAAVALCGLAAGCAGDDKQQAAPQQNAASTTAQPSVTIDQNAIMDRIKVLGSDEYEGRLPGTKGEQLTVRYLEDESKKLGLQPGNPDGTYVQKVPLVGITGAQTQPFTVTKGGQKRTFKWSDDVVAFTKRVADTSSIANSDMIFVGYGVTAPEYNWDDFKGVD